MRTRLVTITRYCQHQLLITGYLYSAKLNSRIYFGFLLFYSIEYTDYIGCLSLVFLNKKGLKQMALTLFISLKCAMLLVLKSLKTAEYWPDSTSDNRSYLHLYFHN